MPKPTAAQAADATVTTSSASMATHAPAMTETKPLPTHRPAPRMGETVQVQLVPGRTLINNESGGFFEASAPTPQTVTTTLLRRLADGDLVLV